MTVYQYTDDWVLRTHPIDTPSVDFGELEPIVELWNSKRKNGAIPAWKDFSFEEFQGWYGWMTVNDFVGEGSLNMFFRLWGTKVTELFGYDPTGQYILTKETEPYEFTGGYVQNDLDFFHELRQDRLIGYTAGNIFWQNREYIRFEEVFLPLADDGRTVDKLFTVTQRLS